MDGGELVAKTLTELGVKQIGVVCGGHITPILIHANGLGIRTVDFRHECDAAFFAMGTSIVTDIPGVAVVTAGPGNSNVFTAIKTASRAQVPMVVIGGAAATFLRGRGSLQDTEQLAYMVDGDPMRVEVPLWKRPFQYPVAVFCRLFFGPSSAAKWAVSIKRQRDIPRLLKKAFLIAQSGVPGPVFMEIPVDVLYDPDIDLVKNEYIDPILRGCGEGLLGSIKRAYVRYRFRQLWSVEKDIEYPSLCAPQRPIINKKKFFHVRDLLLSAERPVIVGGNQLIWLQGKNDLCGALKKLGIPTYLTGLSRGLLERLYPFDRSRKEALAQADLVILAGMAPDFRLKYGQDINRNAQVVRIDLGPDFLKKNLPRAMRLRADPGKVFYQLAQDKELGYRADELAARRTSWIELLRRIEDEKKTADKEEIEKSKNVLPLNPLWVSQRINDLIRPSDIIVVDGGDFVGAAAKVIKPWSARKWIDAGPFGTLGAGTAFAMAAKAAYPELTVWVLYGDGAFGFSTTAEFEAAARQKLGIIGVIGNNGAHEEIRRGDMKVYGASVATELGYVRYDKAVEAYGGWGAFVENPDDLTVALNEALDKSLRGIPAVVNIKIGNTKSRKDSISM